jgi:23S rRNA (adenine2503-C2)-methyltransferase
MEVQSANLMDLTVGELEELCIKAGEKKYRGAQIFSSIYHGVSDIDDLTIVPLALRQKIKEDFHIGHLYLEKRFRSEIDGTTKYLLKLEDGNIIESVLMKYKFGISVCISTQVGCRMGCKFCASTLGGLVRNLSPGEMSHEVLTMQEDYGERVSNIVLMGSGEPLDNFENVIKFLHIVNSREGLNIGMRHITLSTSGLVDEIGRLADLGLQVNLAVSLHAPNDEIRKKIMPVANRYSISQIMEACRHYIKTTNRRITIEYSLIRNVNDRIEDARELASLLKGMLCHVNLIPVNEIKEREYKKAELEAIHAFKDILAMSGIEATIRRELGADIDAACGQLRREFLNK